MLFAVDIGNTNMEFGIYKTTKLVAHFRLKTNHDVTSDEIGLFISQFFQIHNIKIEMIEDVIITSVVPQVIYSVRNAMRKYLKRKPLIVGENLTVDIVNRYRNPAEVGSDRLVNAYAGLKKYGTGLIIIDFGTATTFDVIDREGAYTGGLIYPGIKISLEALAARASKLPKVEIEKPEHVIGTDTVMSMQSGIIYGYTGSVISIVENINKELGYQTKVIATGGLSRMIGSRTDLIGHIDRTLTLDGLSMIYEDQIKNK